MTDLAVLDVAATARHVPLHDLHVALGARMVPFAGYAMPLHYPAGIMAEHRHTRAGASLFDVSHMGQIRLGARSGRIADAAAALERLVPADVAGLAPGRQRYALLTDDAGGIRDDLMVANRGDHLLLVVNAGCKEADEAYLKAAIGGGCDVASLGDRALLALQGPGAEAALARLAPGAAAMRFLDVLDLTIAGVACVVSRSGYTGEDGYEIGMASAEAAIVAEALLAQPGVAPAGLGARDSLRLEAGLCLHGTDIDATTTPVEAALEWSIPRRRRTGGFPGADVILAQLEHGTARRRVGLLPEGRAPVRAGTMLFAAEGDAQPIGEVSSGCFGPSVGAPVAMGYVRSDLAAPGMRLFAELRGRRTPVAVAPLPFVATSYRKAPGMTYYTADHDWLELDGDVATIGITAHAAHALGDLVFVELPAVGAALAKGDVAATVESVKAASEIYAPVGGEVVAVNEALVETPELVNGSPQADGWLFRLRLSDAAEVETLLTVEPVEAA